MDSRVLGRVLIVDDEFQIMELVLAFVSGFGYETFGCASGREAIEVLKKKRFDLLLADLMMPEMDGIKLMQEALEIDSRLTCIILTGQGTVETAVRAMKMGAFDYIMKPLQSNILRSVLSRAMDVHHLKESEEKYRSIVEDQTEFICRWLPDGTITYVNEVFCRYSGKECRELMGSPFPPVAEKDDVRVRERLELLDKENPVTGIEHSVTMPSGKIQWQQWTIRAIFDGEDDALEYQAVGRDVTDRKVAEEALNKSREELKKRVDELEEFYRLAVGRELRMMELKEELEELKEDLEKRKKG